MRAIPSSFGSKMASTKWLATDLVVNWLSEEIARDGGAALVTSLKDYILQEHKVSGKRFNALLVHSNVGKAKLLTFLEAHPTIFQVDRSKSPHWVTLVYNQSAATTNDTNDYSSFLKEILDGAAIDTETQNNLRAQAFDKALLVLRKRQAKTQRRQKRAAAVCDNTNGSDLSKDDNNTRSLVTTDWVNTHWLLGQCCWELHSYLRASEFYLKAYPSPQQVQPVGTRGWETVVLNKFEDVLLNTSTASNETDRRSWIEVDNGKARICDHDSQDGVGESMYNDTHNIQLDNNARELQLLEEIDRALTDIVVHKDGGHQITLGLLLHRYPSFKQLLGGRDLWQLFRTYGGDKTNDESDAQKPRLFQDISMFLSDGNDLVLQSKRPKTVVVTGDGDDDELDQAQGKRMKVDEEGLFSVTNRKWGRAMANFMIRACKETNIYGDCSEDTSLSSQSSLPQRCRTAIDLTASVGGMTLGLAKAKYFDQVVALEIDATRAKLCQENMKTHGYDRMVEVRHVDSVEHIKLLPRNVSIVIDPPWGGFDYKGLVREEAKKRKDGQPQNHLKLGETLLEDVLEKIAHHNAPCIVGIRLPINYDVHRMLLECLEDRRVKHKSVLVRKVGVQLFAVLHFPA